MERGERSLNGPISSIDDKHPWSNTRDRPQCIADLSHMLDFIMEQLAMLSAELAKKPHRLT